MSLGAMKNTFTPEEEGFALVDGNLHEEVMKKVYKAMDEGLDESFAVLDLTVVIKRFELWRECFPNIKPHYAMKANNNQLLLKLMSQLGGSFDCASKAEIENVLKFGVKPDDIIFANTVKFPSHLKFASQNGITLMTFDSEMELVKIKKFAPNARLLLRLKPIIGKMIQYKLDRKFGCSPENSRSLLQFAKSLDLSVVGVSFHVGSGCGDPAPYIANIQAARKVFDVALEEDIHMNILDIGGGFYGNDKAESLLKQMCAPINAALERLFPKSAGYSYISEPGRFFVENCFTVASCVIGMKEPEDKQDTISDTGDKAKDMKYEKAYGIESKDVNSVWQYYISESIFGALQRYRVDMFYDYKPIPVTRQSLQGPFVKSILWGPTCDSQDLIQDGGHLPVLQPNDWLLFENVGAYCMCFASAYNGIPVVPLQEIMNQTVWEQFQTEQ